MSGYSYMLTVRHAKVRYHHILSRTSLWIRYLYGDVYASRGRQRTQYL